MEELSDIEKYNNYSHLVNAIEFIKNKSRITEDWMESQKKYILDVRNHFQEGFDKTNPEVKDKEFRKITEQTETIINSLVISIKYDKTFNVNHYYILLTNMLNMLNIILKDDELSEFMQKMRL